MAHFKADACIAVHEDAPRGVSVERSSISNNVLLRLHNGCGRNGNMRVSMTPELAIKVAVELIVVAYAQRQDSEIAA